MAKIERFEDLICWQKVRGLANLVYDLTERQAAYELATDTKRLINGLVRHLRGKPESDDE